MPKIEDIIAVMRDIAPEETAEPWDNSGLIVGDASAEVKNVLISLDCDDNTVKQAIEKKAQLVITHHPVIFGAVKRITASHASGRRLLSLISNKIAVYSSHTNLDSAESGTNDVLCDLLKLSGRHTLPGGTLPLIRAGYPGKPCTLAEFAEFTASVLNSNGVSFLGDGGHSVNKIGVCAGSAADEKYLSQAFNAGCDVYLTGDVSYHRAQFARDMGLCLVCAPHFASEAPVAEALRRTLEQKASEIPLDVNFIIAENQRDIFNYIRR